MKRFVSLFALLALSTTIALAQGDMMKKDMKDDAKKAMKAETATLKGYIVDKMCASGHKDELGTMAPDHTKSCALSEACLKSGLGLVSEGKWYGFDKKGSEKAASLLKDAKSEKGAMFEVTGEVKGDLIVVSSIKEVATDAM
jgi:hypothetical protein